MSAITPIVHQTLSSEALDRVVEAITSGEFKLGQRISEAEMARKLGISRGPLREALGRLEGRLVNRTPRIGVRVISLSKAKLESLMTTREALEGMAARLAAERMTNVELAHLRELLEEHAARPELVAGEAYIQRSRDDDFHFAIARGARSEVLESVLMQEVYYQLRIHRLRSSTQPGRATAAFTEHRKVVEALESRDPDFAESAMRAHLRNARISALASMLSDDPS